MTAQQKAHMEYLDTRFSVLMMKKYKKGAEEHGGNLWEKDNIIDMAIDEAIDQVVYLLTLRDQLDAVKDKLPKQIAIQGA